ncbi:MAG: hypothetical protein AAFX85_08045 [Pseudomonadota bacterium]
MAFHVVLASQGGVGEGNDAPVLLAQQGATDVVIELIDKGVDVDSCNQAGASLLMAAVANDE